MAQPSPSLGVVAVVASSVGVGVAYVVGVAPRGTRSVGVVHDAVVETADDGTSEGEEHRSVAHYSYCEGVVVVGEVGVPLSRVDGHYSHLQIQNLFIV